MRLYSLAKAYSRKTMKIPENEVIIGPPTPTLVRIKYSSQRISEDYLKKHHIHNFLVLIRSLEIVRSLFFKFLNPFEIYIFLIWNFTKTLEKFTAKWLRKKNSFEKSINFLNPSECIVNIFFLSTT